MTPNSDLPDQQRVRIVGEDLAGDTEDTGQLGYVMYARGEYHYWVRYLTGPNAGLGTTYPRESLEPLSDQEARALLGDDATPLPGDQEAK